MAYKNVEKLDSKTGTFTPYFPLRAVGLAYELGHKPVLLRCYESLCRQVEDLSRSMESCATRWLTHATLLSEVSVAVASLHLPAPL